MCLPHDPHRHFAKDRFRVRTHPVARAPAGADAAGGERRLHRAHAAEGATDEIAADLEYLHKLWASVQVAAHAQPARPLRPAPGPHARLARIARHGRPAYRHHPGRFAQHQQRPAGMGAGVYAFGGRAKPLQRRAPAVRHGQRRRGNRTRAVAPGRLQVGRLPDRGPTGALTTVDVNTGGFVGGRNFDDTIFKTNLEAAQASRRQLRLRNLGGIVIPGLHRHGRSGPRETVLAEPKKALRRDRTRMTVNGFTQLGLVEMTRKRTRDSLAHSYCEPLPDIANRAAMCAPRARVLRDPARDPARGAPVQSARVPHH